MEMKNLNLGELALNETENIKRELARNQNKFSYNNHHYQTKNLTQTDNSILHQINFASQNLNEISFCFNFKTSQTNSDQNYKVLVMLNGVVIKEHDVNNNVFYYFQTNFSAYQQNELKLVVRCENQVIFTDFECELSGGFIKKNSVNKKFFIDFQPHTGEIGVVNITQNIFNYHNYLNANEFMSNFHLHKKSSTQIEGVVDFCFSKEASSYYTPQPVVLINKNNQIVIKNLQTNSEIVANNNTSGHHTIFATTQEQKAIVYVCNHNNTLTIKFFNNNLQLQNSIFGNHKFNHKLTKISAFKSSSIGGSISEIALLLLTESSELFMLFVNISNENLSFLNLNKLGFAENFYYHINNSEDLWVVTTSRNITTKTTYKKRSIGYRKLHSTITQNTKFGFMLSPEISAYYHLNTFSAQS